jgi:uncharacterized protein YbaR (Trm112 family)
MEQLPGKPFQHRKTDQRCRHCRRWFDIRGIDTHEDNCPVERSDFLEYDESKEKIVIAASRCEECGMWTDSDGNEVHRADCSNFSEGDMGVTQIDVSDTEFVTFV